MALDEFARVLKGVPKGQLEKIVTLRLIEYKTKIVIVAVASETYTIKYNNHPDQFRGDVHAFEYFIKVFAAYLPNLTKLQMLDIQVDDTTRNPVGLHSLDASPAALTSFVTNYIPCFLNRIGPGFWVNIKNLLMRCYIDHPFEFEIPNLTLLITKQIDSDDEALIRQLIEHFPGVTLSGIDEIITRTNNVALIELYQSNLNPLIKSAAKTT